MLDFRMDTFLNLCGTMNYTKTAKKLCITQPAVTQHIHYLEHYYGCRLFEYKNKTLTLTPQGKILKRRICWIITAARSRNGSGRRRFRRFISVPQKPSGNL